MDQPVDPAPASAKRRSLGLGLLLGVILVGAVALVVWVARDGGGPEPERIGVPESSAGNGEPAPDTAFERFDGSAASLADYQGRPLVLNFFASWCAPCVREMPDFEAVHQRLGDQVAFLGIANQDRLADAQQIVDETGVSYDLGRDPSGDLLVDVGGIVMPTTVFVSADGEVLELHNGELSADELAARIEEHFGVTAP